MVTVLRQNLLADIFLKRNGDKFLGLQHKGKKSVFQGKRKIVAEGVNCDENNPELMDDPIVLAHQLREKVVKDFSRKYYRLSRPGNWYGGIATADCVGCNLKCIFCWSGFPRDHPDKCGKFYQPEKVAKSLISLARKHSYKQIRISGNEPTLAKQHLLKILKLVDKTSYQFILETNGTLIDKEYAADLAKFQNLQVRVNLKGTNPEEFSLLTGASPEGFNLQLEALKNLTEAGINCWPAVMLSFSSRKNYQKLKKEIKEIRPYLARELEEEYVFLYPHVRERLKKAGLKPVESYSSDKIPRELV